MFQPYQKIGSVSPMPLAPSLQPLPARSGSTRHARAVDYLRISITDRCNERCLYCMPEQFQAWTPREQILTYEEIITIVGVAVQRGFRHFRVTGGEPLLRRDISHFLDELIHTPGVETVQVSTNGTRLPELGKGLFAAGLRRLNISLDALDPERYRAITHGDVAPVLAGIRHAKALGFPSIKLNTVLIRHKNEQEIWPLVEFAASLQIPIRFIELMPVSLTEMLTEKNFLPVGEVFNLLAQRDTLMPLETKLGHGPARYYRLQKTGAIVGFIGALTNLHFCESCNKVRLTADGHLRPCLGHHGEFDLKPALRPIPDVIEIRSRLDQALAEKPPEHEFRNNWQPQRIMTAIGG
jgi:cyclic pyranopterin phosphate synthase